jgi:hypothetical protein
MYVTAHMSNGFANTRVYPCLCLSKLFAQPQWPGCVGAGVGGVPRVRDRRAAMPRPATPQAHATRTPRYATRSIRIQWKWAAYLTIQWIYSVEKW